SLSSPSAPPHQLGSLLRGARAYQWLSGPSSTIPSPSTARSTPIQASKPQTAPCTGRHTRGGEQRQWMTLPLRRLSFALFVLSKALSGRKEESIHAKISPSSRHSRLGTGAAPWRKHLRCTRCLPPSSTSGPSTPQAQRPLPDSKQGQHSDVLNDVFCHPASFFCGKGANPWLEPTG
ncbi:hypothetical protein CORC01_08157, partial [Colletotrichum orchidophilum]